MNDDDKNKQNDDKIEDSEENDKKMDRESEEFQEEIDRLEKEREEHEEKKNKAIERIKKDREKKKKPEQENKQEQKMIGGQLTTVKKKTYDHELKVFRHNRLNDFSVSGTKKMGKVLQKVHGVSLEKKMDFLRAVKAYNPTKSVLKRKDFDDFARKFKSKRFTGTKFKKVEEEGIDIKKMRKEFGKRDIDKLRRGVTGQSDPHKYKSKGSDLRNTPPPSAGRTGRSL
ncbi:MAG: hypothetical protein KAQ64_02555 [Candidatus Pacebacteria bacterium]|nr:hypothetical protein [Candidatus Paceibacterota bacterium]